VVAVIITDTIHSDWGHAFEKALKLCRADATIFYVDKTFANAMNGEIVQAVKDAGKVIIAAYIVPTPGMVNKVGLEDSTGELLRSILEVGAAKTEVIAMGNPYVAQGFPNIENYICTFSNATSSEVGAVKVLFGEIPAIGHLPVTLPGVAQRGFSLQKQPVAARNR
jgi:beta-N-acetylhexosaminidase